MRPDLNLSVGLQVEINYGAVGCYSASEPWEEEDVRGRDAMLAAIEDARESRRFVGVADGVAVLLSPAQTNFSAPMIVEFWSGEPASDDDMWDHVVDIDLKLRGGHLFFIGSGGRPSIICPVRVPLGRYRARVSARGYAQAEARIEGFDSYRLWVWPRQGRVAPRLRRSWSGWAAKVQ